MSHASTFSLICSIKNLDFNYTFFFRLDLEILKEADGALTMTPGGVTPDGEEVGGATLLQVKQLEQQNQRLHDTLVK